MPTLQELLLKAQQGDQTALEALVLRFEPLINRCARQAIEGEREDLQQDLKAKLIALIQKYQTGAERRDRGP